MDQPKIRRARPVELEALRAMHARSLRTLGADYYSPNQIESALVAMGTLDPHLLEDGTYWVAEIQDRIAGSAGFSLRRPNYARLIATPPQPLPSRHGRVGTVRSVFVDPEFARRGVGRRLMAFVEDRMRASGVATAELMGTLSGVPLYRGLGYFGFEDHALRLSDGLCFPVHRMMKPLRRQGALPLAA